MLYISEIDEKFYLPYKKIENKFKLGEKKINDINKLKQIKQLNRAIKKFTKLYFIKNIYKIKFNEFIDQNYDVDL